MIRSSMLLLVALLLPGQASPQDPVPARTESVYVTAYRTAGHVRYSDPETFNKMVDEIMALLEEGRVVIKKDPDRPMIRTEEEMSLSSLINIARLSGANYLLQIIINRPFTKWVEVTIKCHDLDGKILWEEKASEGGGMSGKDAPAKTREKIRKMIAPRLGKPGLPVAVNLAVIE